MTTQTQETTLATIAQPFNLPDVIKNKVLDTLAPFVADAGVIAREAEGVNVTDATQTDLIKKSKDLRTRIGKVRIAADKARKALKEEYLKPGQYIDAAGRHIASLIEPVESRLENQEKIVERQEEEQRQKRVLERSKELNAIGVEAVAYDLGHMSDEAYADLLAGQKALATQRREQAQREADAKAAADKLRDEQEAATRAENERLRREKAEADQKLREAAEATQQALKAKLAAEEAERQTRLKAEREEQARKDAEAAKAKAEAAAARKAAKAPDKDKILAVAKILREMAMPKVTSDEAADILLAARRGIDLIAASLEDDAERNF